MAAAMTLRTFLSKYLYLTRRPCVLCLREQHSAATAQDGKSHDGPIIIPKKVKRDSLTILKALAGTVKHDPSRLTYSILDDPYVTQRAIPNTNLKKKLSLAKDSGRKTARYMAHLYRDAFENDTAQPPVKAFDLDPLYECTTVGEVALKERIEQRKVVHALEIYRKMVSFDMEVSQPVLMSLLELLCVFSESDPPETRYQEENRFKSEFNVEAIAWIPNGVAETIFDSLPEKTDRSYNWMLKGYCKFDESKKAFALYEEMKAIEVKVDLSGYHGLLLQSTANLKSSQEVFDKIKDLWTAMKSENYPPSLETFNSSLKALPGNSSSVHAAAIMAEMTAIGIEADSTTMGQLLRCSYTITETESRQNATADHLYLVNDVFNYINQNSVDMNNYNADLFFTTAMAICRHGGHSQLAIMVYNLLEKTTMMEIFTKSQEEHTFFTHFLSVLLKNESLKTVMAMYEKFVPNLSFPLAFLRRELIEKIQANKNYEYIPTLWRDYMGVDHHAWELCKIMATAECSKELREEFFLLFDSAWKKKTADSSRKRGQMMRWITGELVEHGIQIAINADRLDVAVRYLCRYQELKSSVEGFVSDHVLDKLIDAFIEKQTFFYAPELMEAIQIWSELAADDPASLLHFKMDKLPAVLHPHQLEKLMKDK